MKILVSGDRDYTNREIIRALLAGIKCLHEDVTLIEGEARGADTIAREAGEEFTIDIEPYPAEWDKYGKAGGPIRNRQMLKEGEPDVVFCFHDDFENSKGTKDMATIAVDAGVPTYLITKLG